jgi:hypothetical protein
MERPAAVDYSHTTRASRELMLQSFFDFERIF